MASCSCEEGLVHFPEAATSYTSTSSHPYTMATSTPAYSASATSDDLAEYDVISDDLRDLESSMGDLSHVEGPGATIQEPPVADAAREKLKTASLSAEDVQTFVRRATEGSISERLAKDIHRRRIRVYVDGVFDYHVGHALQLRQAKLSFPYVHLMVGVFSDELCRGHDTPALTPHMERCEILRHNRWVDEIIPDAPFILTDEYVAQRAIDFVALEEGTSIDPGIDKARVKAYDVLKGLGKVIPTRRTFGLAAPVMTAGTNTSRPSPVATLRNLEEETIPEPRMDVYGIGL